MISRSELKCILVQQCTGEEKEMELKTIIVANWFDCVTNS